MPLLLKSYSVVEVIHLLIRFSKTFISMSSTQNLRTSIKLKLCKHYKVIINITSIDALVQYFISHVKI